MGKTAETKSSYELVYTLDSLVKPEPPSRRSPALIQGAQTGGENLKGGRFATSPTASAGSSDSETEMPNPPALLERTRKRSAVPEGEVLTHFRPL